MGLYIKDMEMPKEGSWVTLRVFPDGQCILYSWCGNDFDFMEHLTAVPVPPHGRMIDADEFLKRAIGTKCFWGDYVLMLEELVGESTTIIPPKEET